LKIHNNKKKPEESNKFPTSGRRGKKNKAQWRAAILYSYSVLGKRKRKPEESDEGRHFFRDEGGKKKSQWRAATMYSHSILKKKGKNQRKVTRAATSCGEEEKIA